MSTARDVMRSPAITVPASAPPREVARTLRANDTAAAAVVGADGTLLGVISVEDLLSCMPGMILEGEAPGPTAAMLMTAPAVAVAPGAKLAEVAWLMHREDVGQVPVVDEARRPLGMVRRVDILATFLRGAAAIRRDILGIVGPELAPRVRCEITAGVVTLRGAVPDRRAAERIADLALDVEGVVAVRNELEAPSA